MGGRLSTLDARATRYPLDGTRRVHLTGPLEPRSHYKSDDRSDIQRQYRALAYRL